MRNNEQALEKELTFTRFDRMCEKYPDNAAVVYLGEKFSYARLRDLSERTGKLVTEIEPEARRALMQSEWSGNVRELKNVLERAVILTQGTSIGLEHLPARLQQGHGAAASAPFRLPAGGLDMEDLERMLLLQALEQAQQNKSEAARLLGMSRATLRYRLRKYGLEAA